MIGASQGMRCFRKIARQEARWPEETQEAEFRPSGKTSLKMSPATTRFFCLPITPGPQRLHLPGLTCPPQPAVQIFRRNPTEFPAICKMAFPKGHTGHWGTAIRRRRPVHRISSPRWTVTAMWFGPTTTYSYRQTRARARARTSPTWQAVTTTVLANLRAPMPMAKPYLRPKQRPPRAQRRHPIPSRARTTSTACITRRNGAARSERVRA